MARTLTFNELRALKDKLPDGSIHRIAEELGLKPETVRNYFGGYNYKEGKSIGVHIEKMIFKVENWFKWLFNIPPISEQ